MKENNDNAEKKHFSLPEMETIIHCGRAFVIMKVPHDDFMKYCF